MSIGAGDVKISLINLETGEPEELVMKPSYRAAKAINAHFRGYANAIESVSRVDFEALTEIIKHGVGFTPIGAKDLGDRVYRTGPMELAAPVVEYLSVLMNGGKPMSDQKIEGGEAGEP